jgi:hypothetical protein
MLRDSSLLKNHPIIKIFSLSTKCALLLLFTACGNKDCKNGSCEGENFAGNAPIKAKADLTNAFGLLVVDKSESAPLKLMERHNKKVSALGLPASQFSYGDKESFALLENGERSYMLGEDSFTFPPAQGEKNLGLSEDASADDSSLQKIDSSSGKITDALTQVKDPNLFNPNQLLPKLSTIAIAPTGEVYLHFERSYIYRDAPASQDPHNPSNGYQCQIFRVEGGTLDSLLTTPPERENLVCVDNQHFIDSWRSYQNGVFQFDSSGNLYYPGSIPNVNKTVVYRMSRDGQQASEVINANICVQNFLITSSGGTFYTGQTCQNGQNSGGDPNNSGFFRYVAPGTNGSVLEIARNWWNFIYAPSISQNQTDTAVFFGPDPRIANTASWDTACLFNFDPSGKEVTDRISETITCGNNIGDWMEMNRKVDITAYGEGYHNYTGTDKNYSPSTAWKEEYSRRCISDGEVFAGGGSQISEIKQNSNGDVFVIGNIRKKQKGQVSCSVAFRGPHCTINDMPVLIDDDDSAYTKTTCLAANGTWVNEGNCSNGTTKAEGCVDVSRTWTAGYCSNPDYRTKATCIAATGCSSRWYNNQTDCQNAGYTWHGGSGSSFLVWRTGSCSSDPDKYETEAACIAASKVWRADTWSGACTSSDTNDNSALYDNNQNGCIPNWSTNQMWYNNVTGDICTSDDTADRASFWDYSHKNNNFTQTADSTHSTFSELTGKYLVQGLQCNQVNSASGGRNDWTMEYSALAQVDASKKNLTLLSLSREKAIDLWVVNEKPYYSSFDTASGEYLLNGLTMANACIYSDISEGSSCNEEGLVWQHRRCFASNLSSESTCKAAGYQWVSSYPSVILSNFEVYNLAEGENSGEMLADGLDFSTNEYKFGTINPDSNILQLRTGLTGTLKTIVILPRN